MKDKKFTVSDFREFKARGEKIAMLTAYDYSMAKLLDDAGVDSLLVGDSLGMTMLGYENTLQVTMEDMIHHTKAVRRGTKNAFLVADMPYLSYEINVEEAVRNAGRLVREAQADAVKVEGGYEMVETIKAIVRAKIPVVAHLGLTPQSVNIFGGFKVQGKNLDQAQKLIEEALAVQEAGACAVVLECIPSRLAKVISEKLEIPTIGIGAGADCDGQVLVIQDMIGMFKTFTPKFVKKFASVGEEIEAAVEAYITEIKSGAFPGPEHTFKLADEVLEKLY
ncbi:3-methyl-2-oxobutanoate hydroxymethyltransferase [Acidaminobacter hydrogenoformans]|uniref:3-methyl-2-oxobutanoate hydroxymethyltransferase n=1 Tax=Acidaminobacter hydrogenoformans DSM 2784 TaxID=1120920 RepID=A0A1G5S312_9FIRM|nr:3-methyl-2-oxobutanoate hydroxymethyltransferase [Acidaminobacter hydrogenoformans]SCZ80703.1 ketopantoate hydroxymethyltransferase [Acidaminobacter hydrogenoformans DSM 2784]